MPAFPRHHARLERLRARIAYAPREVLDEVSGWLERHDLPTADRLRFLGLAVACGRDLADLRTADRAAEEGLQISCRSAVAVADFRLQVASLRTVEKRREEARAHIDLALSVVERELAKPARTGRSREQGRRRMWLTSWKAACLIVRGEIVLHLGGDLAQSLQDGVRALRIASANLARGPRHRKRVFLAATTLLSFLVMRQRSFQGVIETLDLLSTADHLMADRMRLRRDHPYRLRVQGCRALAFARLGSTELAEKMLFRVVEGLAKHGLPADAEAAKEALIWVIERGGKTSRAAYIRRTLLSTTR